LDGGVLSDNTGVADMQNDESDFVFPFSISTIITLTNYSVPFNVQLFDELGREALLQYHSSQQANNTIITVDRGELKSGLYFLSIISKEEKRLLN